MKKKRSKKSLSIILGLILLGAFFYWYSGFTLVREAEKRYDVPKEEISFEIKPGESIKEVGKNLKDQGNIKNSGVFISYAEKKGWDKKVKPGVYTLDTTMSIKDMLVLFMSGNVEEVWITIPEGWRIDQIGQYLEDQGLVGAKEFEERAKVKYFNDTAFLSSLSGNTSLEGYLFPDTYKVFAITSADEIIQKMLDNFASKVTSEVMNKANQMGFTLHEFITLTSIIEKESAHSADIRKISSVYHNRLENEMLLQSDATVTYITRRADARPTFDETRTNSPYNTYLYKGLPPGPVGNPGLEAIEATLNPEETDYLFFVSQGNRAYFAETYEGHLDNIAKYLD